MSRAENTLRQLAQKGGPITFRPVAEEAGVSSSWLYRQDELRHQIDQLRDTPAGRASSLSRPSSAPPSTPCANNCVPTAARPTRLRLEDQALHEQLAHHLGAQRAAATSSPR